MTVIVTLDMYSGLPNPSWELSDEDAQKLKAMLASRVQISSATSPGALSRLGYRGLIVSASDPNLAPSVLRAFDGILEAASLAQPNVIDHDSEVELFLLGTAGTALRRDEYELVREQVEKNVEGGPAGSSKGFEPMAEPPFDPGKWNNNETVRLNNNCYNYANDKITNTFAQPGRASGFQAPYPPSCGGTSEGATKDGLISIPDPAVTPVEGQVVALVVAPGPQMFDYHWYRRDSNGKWSHKPGSTSATNRDNSGKAIDDPRNCDRGPYGNFCGFYNAIPSKTRIR